MSDVGRVRGRVTGAASIARSRGEMGALAGRQFTTAGPSWTHTADAGKIKAVIPARALTAVPSPEDLVGSYRRFGDFGPVYEVQRVEARLPEGDAVLHLLVPETSEEVDVLYSIVLLHPEAD